MQNGREHLLPLERLARDIRAHGQPDPGRLHAAERLTAELGADLLAAVHSELARLEARAFPLRSRPRRVA